MHRKNATRVMEASGCYSETGSDQSPTPAVLTVRRRTSQVPSADGADSPAKLYVPAATVTEGPVDVSRDAILDVGAERRRPIDRLLLDPRRVQVLPTAIHCDAGRRLRRSRQAEQAERRLAGAATLAVVRHTDDGERGLDGHVTRRVVEGDSDEVAGADRVRGRLTGGRPVKDRALQERPRDGQRVGEALRAYQVIGAPPLLRRGRRVVSDERVIASIDVVPATTRFRLPVGENRQAAAVVVRRWRDDVDDPRLRPEG